MALGLSKDALERRKHEGCRDLRLLKQVLRAWLKGDKQKRTWRCLVKAIDNLDGEAAHSVAMEIASLHPSGQYSLLYSISVGLIACYRH